MQGTTQPFQSPLSPTLPSPPWGSQLPAHWALGQASAPPKLCSLIQKRHVAGPRELKQRAHFQSQPNAWGRVLGDFEFLSKMVWTLLH